MDFSVGSFNLCKFSYQSDKEIKKDIKKIAEIIRESEFDIVALQEVMTPGVLDRETEVITLNGPARGLLQELGTQEWDSVWAQPKSEKTNTAEGYAVLWKKGRFRIATGMTKTERGLKKKSAWALKQFAPRIQDAYKEDKVLYAGRLARDPLYVRLEAIHSWFEVRLIDTHIMFGDNSTANIEARQHEFHVLTDIYRSLSEKQYRSSRTSYTILLGDYNLCLGQSPEVPDHVPYYDRNKAVTQNIVTVQRQATSLKQHQKDDDPSRYANNYDHFSYDEIWFRDGHVIANCSRIDAVEFCNNNLEEYRRTVSDHVPVRLDVSLTGR